MEFRRGEIPILKSIDKGSRKKETKRFALSSILLMFILIIPVLSACSDDTVGKSSIDGVSDEVYEGLVQFYFYTTTIKDVVTGEIDMEEKSDKSWITDHDLYEDAEEYAENIDDVYPDIVFPNPLMYEYTMEPESFSDTEQTYLEKMEKFIDASNRLNLSEYEPLKEQLKEDLKIKDSDNMFDPS